MNTPNKAFYILSAMKDTNTAGINIVQTRKLRKALEQAGMPYKQVGGMYKGTFEVSFVVVLNNLNYR